MSESDAPADFSSPERGERIAKWLARAGVASRRDAEALIAEGHVTLNGHKVESPATFVAEGDTLLVRGQPVGAAEPTRLFRYHKPDNLVTTHKDPQGRPTVFEKLPAGLPRLVSIGRLDLTSEGLLLLTNDGALARRLELPSNGWGLSAMPACTHDRSGFRRSFECRAVAARRSGARRPSPSRETCRAAIGASTLLYEPPAEP